MSPVGTSSAHFFAKLFLPFWVRAEQERGPREQVRGGVVAREEEGLALVDDLVHAEHRALAAALRRQHQPEQVVTVPVGTLGGEPALDDAHEHGAHLPVEVPRLEVVLGWEVPAEPWDMDVEDGGEDEEQQIPLRQEHLLPFDV
jgi:hypothetical protein